MRRSLLLALLLVTTVAPSGAAAQTRCPQGVSCRTVTVPLDRSGTVAGTVRLRVAVLRAERKPTRPPLLVLSGGPGQANIANLPGWVDDLGARVLAERDLIVFDPRGTGRSGALSCPGMQRAVIPRDTAAAEACAVRLGESRRFYTTIDQAEDVEAVRVRLGADQLALYGISYGTKVALTYSRLHPERVQRLVLDSVVPAEGSSALSQEILGAMPRVLGHQLPLIASLLNRIRSTPAVGVAVDDAGKRHRRTAYPAAIFDVLLHGDFNRVLRQALPAAIRALEAGDPAPLVRLIHAAQEGERLPPRASVFSAGLYAATSCEEIAFPWASEASFAERARAAREAAGRAAALTPFAAEDVLTLDWIPLCLRWPLTPGPRPLPATTPTAPALLISGEADLRTPVEDARRVHEQLPNSTLLTVPGVGHSVVGSDPHRCARAALRAFLRARAIRRSCKAARTGFERGIRTPPRRLADLRGRGRVGKTFTAVVETLFDSELAIAISPSGEAAGGLRSGTVRYSGGPVHRLRRYEYVPGVIVTTRGRTVRVTGRQAAAGTLTLTRDRRLVGRLGGRTIR